MARGRVWGAHTAGGGARAGAARRPLALERCGGVSAFCYWVVVELRIGWRGWGMGDVCLDVWTVVRLCVRGSGVCVVSRCEEKEEKLAHYYKKSSQGRLISSQLKC